MSRHTVHEINVITFIVDNWHPPGEGPYTMCGNSSNAGYVMHRWHSETTEPHKLCSLHFFNISSIF